MRSRGSCALLVVVPSADAMPAEACPLTKFVMDELVVPIDDARPALPVPSLISFSMLDVVVPAVDAIPVRLMVISL